MEYTKLSNDVRLPLLGLGTFMISPEDTEKSVYDALKMGYRLIDTANAYLNEEAVGKGIKKALDEGLVKREDIFYRPRFGRHSMKRRMPSIRPWNGSASSTSISYSFTSPPAITRPDMP